MTTVMDEKTFRKRTDQLFQSMTQVFEAIDPDVVECEYANGNVVLLFADRTKCILSQQPSVRQIWLANASEGVALHFSFSEGERRWLDDKGQGIDLLGYVEALVLKRSGEKIDLRARS